MVLAYAVLAGATIALSDVLILSIAADTQWLGYFLAFKGTLVAGLTGTVLVLLMRRDQHRDLAVQQELYLARHDPSTKLLSRNEWIKRVDAVLNDPFTRHEPAVVITVLVDSYDYLVHRYGSGSLHQWLGVFGRYLRMLAKGDDLVGSVSPAVFVVHVHGPDCREQAIQIVERMLEAGKRTFLVKGEPVTLNLNIGICSYPQDGVNAEDLLARANIAMRRATAEGVNRHCWYKPEIAEQVLDRVRMQRDLEHALERGEMELHFQPRVCLGTGSMCGAEALLRWRHPRRGMVPPAAFIGLAEESGLIVDIGKWVVAESVGFLREWAAAGLAPINVSLNVSPAQLSKGDFLKDLGSALGAHREYAPFLELELTESLAMNDPHLTMLVLQQVKKAGMRVALDDFGTGYSSLSYLQRFPIDTLKIDRCFIGDLTENRNSQELIKTVITLGHSLGVRVCAEGVESRAQMDILSEYDCDEVQGFFYGEPGPAERLIEEVRRGLPVSRPGWVPAGACAISKGVPHVSA
ncbi:MAG TPA: GGDEF domain-containing phosphodiesterase [Gammaproteobacteria bacterium]|jgi:diguanylate cyclase (GGDEF)-like protein